MLSFTTDWLGYRVPLGTRTQNGVAGGRATPERNPRAADDDRLDGLATGARIRPAAASCRRGADLLEATINFAELAEREITTWQRTDRLGMTGGTQAILEELAGRDRATT
jgi:hypothetical protein